MSPNWEIVEINDSSYIKDNNFIKDFLDNNDFAQDVISPGRQRLIENSNKNKIDWDINQDYYFENEIVTGSIVFHKKYGNGKILKLDNDKALVDFENYSTKKIYLKFLKIID